MNLYDVMQELRDLDDKARRGEDWNEDGEVVDLNAMIAAVECERDAKIDALCKLREEAKAEAAAVATIIKRLARRKRAAENLADSYQAWITLSMDLSGTKRLRTDAHTVTLQWFDHVQVDDVNELPAEYTRTKIEADKTAIKKALLADGELVIPGACIIEQPKAVVR